MKDLFGKALFDYHRGCFESPLLLHNQYGAPEEIPVEGYFRDEADYSELEVFALESVKGRVLDIGAATGRHALFLQRRNMEVTALDLSPLCGELMRERGVKKVVVGDVMHFGGDPADTLMMLMNGIGLAGNLRHLSKFLRRLKSIVKPRGQILLDSSDISYLYQDVKLPESKYYGELTFHYEYKGETDTPFMWLYIDQKRLIKISKQCGWYCQIIFEDETDAYLARLTHL